MARTIDRPPPPGSGGPDPPGLEARVAKLEAAVEHIERDVAEIKVILGRLATVVDRMDGFLQATFPTLATKAELAAASGAIKAELATATGAIKAELATTTGAIKAELATTTGAIKAELANLEARLSVEIARRPTTAGVIAVVAVMIAIAGLPYWGHWLADVKMMLGLP